MNKKLAFDASAALSLALDDDRCEAAASSDTNYGQPFMRCPRPAIDLVVLENFPRAELAPRLHYVRVCRSHAEADADVEHWLRPVWPSVGSEARLCPCRRWLGKLEIRE